ncbi:hypothetical protein C8R45DRAFT_929363 [Mycena sanguinolenta]|nr:hypothetical protein C8R45DRAFT_929363 [Mycena sanguinolenta]
MYAYLAKNEISLSRPSTNGHLQYLPRMRLDWPRPGMGGSSTKTQKNRKGVFYHSTGAQTRAPSITVIPIAKMLEFQLPLQNGTVTAPQPAQYFSTAAPHINDAAMMLRIRHLPIPDPKTINKRLACSCQCWLDSVRSVIYSHIGGVVTHFPLWILTYWAAVGEIKRDAWGPWRKSQE